MYRSSKKNRNVFLTGCPGLIKPVSVIKYSMWLIIIFLSSYCLLVHASSQPDHNVIAFMEQAHSYYEEGDYKNASEIYQKVSTIEPSNARAFHLLGKSYGRLAQESGWLKAIGFAKKTHTAFNQAANLAPNNLEILNDLIQFHSTAPGFLGGDKKKARQLQKKLFSIQQRNKIPKEDK